MEFVSTSNYSAFTYIYGLFTTGTPPGQHTTRIWAETLTYKQKKYLYMETNDPECRFQDFWNFRPSLTILYRQRVYYTIEGVIFETSFGTGWARKHGFIESTATTYVNILIQVHNFILYCSLTQWWANIVLMRITCWKNGYMPSVPFTSVNWIPSIIVH